MTNKALNQTSPLVPSPLGWGRGRGESTNKLFTVAALVVVLLLVVAMWAMAFNNGGGNATSSGGGSIPPSASLKRLDDRLDAKASTNSDGASTIPPDTINELNSGASSQIKLNDLCAARSVEETEEMARLRERIISLEKERMALEQTLKSISSSAKEKSSTTALAASSATALKKELASTNSSSSSFSTLVSAGSGRQSTAFYKDRTNPRGAPSAWKRDYIPASENAKGGAEWSFDTLERQYEANLKSAVYYRGTPQFGIEVYEKNEYTDALSDRNVLFVDGRERCEASRGFLIRVRQGGFRGRIVYLAYYLEDEIDCQPLANDFQPMEIFYRPTPLYEPTLQKFHGVLNYYKAFKTAFDGETSSGANRPLFEKAILVQPEAVFWCNETNPFDDIPTTGKDMESPQWPYADRYGKGKSDGKVSRDSIFGIIGTQSDISNAHVEGNDIPLVCTRPSGRYNGTEEDKVRKDNDLVDAFIGTSNAMSLINFAKMMVDYIEMQEHNNPHGAWEIFKNHAPVRQYLNDNLVQMQPIARYEAAVCQNYLPDDFTDTVKCQHCDRHSIIAGTLLCIRQVTADVPNYTPYCLQPYRDAILEVPSRMSMVGYAVNKTLSGAWEIRDKPKGIFDEPADSKRSVTEQCPHGMLGVLTMMAGYDVTKVKSYIGSFLSHSDSNCSRMIMLVKANMKFENLEKYFPGRVEIVILDEKSDYYPTEMKDCGAADYRFEVAQRWLEKNYHLYRYIMATDSRDYIWQADPFEQLRKTLAKQGYQNDEFVASVAETVVFGGSAHPTQAVTYYVQQWLQSCSQHGCFRRMGHASFTNGEPFAILNSGHVIGTSLGLLHYYRFHVRMMKESKHKCDGTDQGLFTYYMYGMLQEAHYPHKVLVFSSSRSGFANLPHPSRMSKRRRTDLVEGGMSPQQEREFGFYHEFLLEKDKHRLIDPSTDPYYSEYMITDCNNNVIAGLHQFDRHYPDLHYLDRSPAAFRIWKQFSQKEFKDEFVLNK